MGRLSNIELDGTALAELTIQRRESRLVIDSRAYRTIVWSNQWFVCLENCQLDVVTMQSINTVMSSIPHFKIVKV